MQKCTFSILLIACVSLFARGQGAVTRPIPVITAKGDTIVFNKPVSRQLRFSSSGETKTTSIYHSRPVSINGRDIWFFGDDTTDGKWVRETEARKKAVAEYRHLDVMLDSSTAMGRRQLPDGEYRVEIENMVIDQYGRIAYFELGELKKEGRYMGTFNARLTEQPPAFTAQIITEQMKPVMDKARFTPLVKDGVPIAYLQNYIYRFSIRWN